MELFRQFAVVKSVFIVRDWATGASRGLAFLEFHSVEHASFAMQVYDRSSNTRYPPPTILQLGPWDVVFAVFPCVGEIIPLLSSRSECTEF